MEGPKNKIVAYITLFRAVCMSSDNTVVYKNSYDWLSAFSPTFRAVDTCWQILEQSAVMKCHLF